MTRHYRVVHELENAANSYIVQGDGDHRSQWADVARFPNPDDAHHYITDVLERHRILEEVTR